MDDDDVTVLDSLDSKSKSSALDPDDVDEDDDAEEEEEEEEETSRDDEQDFDDEQGFDEDDEDNLELLLGKRK